MNENHLIVFVKNPVLGKVKTRLAAGIGNEYALQIYLKLLDITRIASRATDCTRHVFYSDEIETDAWDDDEFNKHVQEGDELGQRMKNAFEKVFALGARKAVIIGSDCPLISSAILTEAFNSMNQTDTVIGPAKDGGYYLLGMKELHPFLFENKEWSTDSVFEYTLIDLMENRLTYHRLEKLSDLDTIYDLYLLE
jgi:rSAM/selenodomain-associated transferase 1